MNAVPGNVRVWLATGHTDTRRDFPRFARLVRESLQRDPHIGDLSTFSGAAAATCSRIIWHEGQVRVCSLSDWNGLSFCGHR
jgi:transposase